MPAVGWAGSVMEHIGISTRIPEISSESASSKLARSTSTLERLAQSTSDLPVRLFHAARSVQHTSQYFPNFRPTSENTPTTLNPNRACSSADAVFGNVYPPTY